MTSRMSGNNGKVSNAKLTNTKSYFANLIKGTQSKLANLKVSNGEKIANQKNGAVAMNLNDEPPFIQQQLEQQQAPGLNAQPSVGGRRRRRASRKGKKASRRRRSVRRR